MKSIIRTDLSKLYVLSLGFLLIDQGATFADGVLGTQSDTSFNVSVEVSEAPTLISITGLSDIMIDKIIGEGAGDEQDMQACVYMTDGETYSVEVAADALVSGNQHYPYKIKLSQSNVIGAPELLLDVGATTSNDEQFGFTGSPVEGCPLRPKLTVSVIDVGSTSISEAFSAQAVVRLTVKPE